MDNKYISNLLFPNINTTINDYLNMYPKRNLPENAMVTRFAPSPTGYVHFGSLLTCFINKKMAKDTGGVFYLRIEDTDRQRKVENGIEGIVKDLQTFDINPDEGVFFDNAGKMYEKGQYASYIQSNRKDIYLTFVKHLVAEGKAYPCFCSKEDLDKTRELQMQMKTDHIGYYGEYATCRHLTQHQIEKNIKQGKPFVVRLKSTGRVNSKIKIKDELRGKVEMQDNVIDSVILKSDTQLPPYNLAHVVDDTLMGTTLVMRASEWLNSTPEHLQIFRAFGFTPPKYAHVPFVQIIDEETGAKRKLSKRKDVHTAISNLKKVGYPTESVNQYLMTLANTNFEDWSREHSALGVHDFTLQLDKMSLNGALYDQIKFDDISKNVISKFTSEQVYNKVLNWAKEFDKQFYEVIKTQSQLFIDMLDIDRKSDKPTKAIVCWKSVKELYFYFFNEYFDSLTIEDYDLDESFTSKIIPLLERYLQSYNVHDTKVQWFDKVKNIATEFNYAVSTKDYKVNPNNFAGSIVHLSNFIRVAVTSRKQSLDLYGVCQVIGVMEMTKRINKFIQLLKR